MIFRNSRNRLRAEKFLGLFAVVILSLLFVYWQVNMIKDKLRDSILATQVVAIDDFVKNSQQLFMQNFGDENITEILENKEALNDIENSLEILNSKSYKFIYILYKTKRDKKYRFLSDSSLNKKEKRTSQFPVGSDYELYNKTLNGHSHLLIFKQMIKIHIIFMLHI